jgi:RNA recognition motif-containing protein
MNIYVGNLSPEVKEEDLTELFSQHGKVSSAKVIKDMFTQESRPLILLNLRVKSWL